MLTLSRGSADISGLWDVRDGPQRTGNKLRSFFFFKDFVALVAFIHSVRERQEGGQREDRGDMQQRVVWARSRTRNCCEVHSLCTWTVCPNHCATGLARSDHFYGQKRCLVLQGLLKQAKIMFLPNCEVSWCCENCSCVIFALKNMCLQYSRSEVMLTFFERSPLDQVLRNDKVHRIQPCFDSPIKISGTCSCVTERWT